MAAHPELTRDDYDSDVLAKDTVFSVLSNQRRRDVVRFLRTCPDGSTVRELSQQLAAWENDLAVDELTYKQRKRVYTSLHQTHLPTLASSGIIDYDRDRGTVTLTEQATTLDNYLDVGTDESSTVHWANVYLSLAAAGGGAVILRWFGVLPAWIPDLTLAGLLALAVAIVAGVHGYSERGWPELEHVLDGE